MRDTAFIDAPLAPPIARLEGVRLTRDGQPLIDGLDLALPDGGITAIMGPNGAGKSLCLKLLHGLVTPERGTVLWHGVPLSEATRRRQALVFQKPVLLRRSVAANIDFVLRARGRRDPARRDALLAHVGLVAHAARPARALSGGEQQRLAIARALATEPEVLFLDEPTASLDPASIIAVEEILTAARDDGIKIVLVTHDIGQARRLADDVAFLHRGRLAEHAPAARFLSAPATTPARAFLEGRLVP